MSIVEKIELEPIRFVKTNTIRKEVKKRSNVSEIILREDLVHTLHGIEDFSHLYVIFWMHEVPKEERKKVKVHPRGRRDLPLLGIFATRTPHRPNPIGLTLVELIKVNDNTLTIRGLDAYDCTPIIDIKPFDMWDTTEDVKVPKWWTKLEKECKN